MVSETLIRPSLPTTTYAYTTAEAFQSSDWLAEHPLKMPDRSSKPQNATPRNRTLHLVPEQNHQLINQNPQPLQRNDTGKNNLTERIMQDAARAYGAIACRSKNKPPSQTHQRQSRFTIHSQAAAQAYMIVFPDPTINE